MAHCFKHNYEHDLLGGCRHCSLEDELKEQSRVNERLAKEQIKAQDEALRKQTQAQIEAMQEDARRREQLHYEALEEQQRIAEESVFEQQRIAQATISAQRHNIANAWRLESQAKVDQAFEMFNAEMFEEALDLAQQAIGEKGSGDVGNILGHLVASSSLLALGKANEAEKYFSSQLKLLNTSDYYDNAEIHKIVFDTLPKNDGFLPKFNSVVRQNAVNWEISEDYLALIKQFLEHNLMADAKHLAQLCISKLEESTAPLQHWGIIHRFTNLDLKDEAVNAARVTIKTAPKMLSDKSNFPNLIVVLKGLMLYNILTEAKQLSELMIKMNNFFGVQILRQEILHRAGQPFDKWLKQFLNSVSSSERNSVYSQLQTVSSADDVSPTTLAFVKGQVGERYQQWISSIAEDMKAEALKKEDYSLTLPIGLMIGAFVLIVFCFPIGFIVMGVWAFKIFQNYQKLQKAKTTFYFQTEQESKKWSSMLSRSIKFSDPLFSLNSVELTAFLIALSLYALITLLFLL